jgi:hypothetical protein
MRDVADAVGRIRRPEYTGENRCLPCTAVNAVLAAVAAFVVAVLGSPIGAAALFGGCLLLIYFRGYLVPGTPEITARYFPERVLRLFGKSRPDVDTLEDADETTRALVRADVLGQDPSDDALRPAPDFRESWRRRVRNATPRADAVADALGATDATRLSEASFVLDGDKRLWWESEAALVADLAAAAELRDRFDEWSTLDRSERADLLRVVRAFLPHCPQCGGRPTVERRRVDHCCRPPREALRSTCTDCGAILVETVIPDDPEWFEALPANE